MQGLSFCTAKLHRSIVHIADQSSAGKQVMAAEGMTQMDTVRRLTCHAAQGLWLYKPMQARGLHALICQQSS
ncbi:MAG TPA: hypothetical protein DE179_11040 [Oceanospirillaceae bacterium]|nr:hypothetical protein [Oceanospirillaceae bacterium]